MNLVHQVLNILRGKKNICHLIYLKFYIFKDGKQTKSAGSTQKRLEEFRNYEKLLKTQPSNSKQEEPFVTNRHPKVS